MSVAENKAIVNRMTEDFWNAGNLAVADELFAADFVFHDLPPGFPPGIEGVKEILTSYLAGFPDLHVTSEDQIAEGDRVVNRWTMRCTHTGDYMGIPATGNPLVVKGSEIFRIAGGKIVEVWSSWDSLGMMQQLA